MIAKNIDCFLTLQIGLGLLHEYGDGVEQNHQRALQYYRTLTLDSDPIGMHRLALMYFYGKGASVNYKFSFTILQKVITGRKWTYDIRNFCDESQYVTEKPFVYQQCNSTGFNPQTDLVYCTMNITRLKGESKYYVGLMYNNGLGVLLDKERAQRYFREAYRDGCQRACSEITPDFDD